MLEYDPHPSHEIYDEGYLVSDPVCKHCRDSIFNGTILWPCEAQLKLPFDKE